MMNSQQWQRLSQVYEAVLDRPAYERDAFLAAACEGDEALRREVEALLAQENRIGPLDRPVYVADHMVTPHSTLANGTVVGPYRVEELLGVGGMGEVYRARDTILNRHVALKILPARFASDLERLTRFQREAQILAALNHPHIAAIYGIEQADSVRALVLELVEGETLADGISRGPVPLEDALPIVQQIVGALESAHEQGIVHRDLKPSNIKITADGVVKVLDFGLARLTQQDSLPQTDLTASPTNTSPALVTSAGIILGTAAYMAPEQAKGRVADARSDIWAFGCVLFEMLSGRRAFEGEDVSDTLAAVLRGEPEWAALPRDTPSSIHRLLHRCLEKNRKRRLAHIADARLDIDDALGATGAEMTPTSSASATRSWTAVAGWMTAVALGLLAAALGVMKVADPVPDTAPAVRFEIAPPKQSTILTSGTVSPDGRLVAFVARERDRMTIWVRSLDALEARPLRGTEAPNIGRYLFWSPDNRFIGYAAGSSLRKVDVSGGPPQTLANLEGPLSQYRGGAWSREGVVIFGLHEKGLRQVAAEGGRVSVLTTVDLAHESSHIEPVFLPDGRRFLFTRLANRPEDSGVFVGALVTGSQHPRPQPLVATSSGVAFVPSADPSVGQLLFVRGGTLMTQSLDTVRLELRGQPVPVTANLSDLAPRVFSASSTNVLTVRDGDASAASRVISFDRQGKSLGDVGPPGRYGDVVLAADGNTLVVSQSDRERPHLWIVDLKREVRSRLNPGDEIDYAPAISRDGRIVFTSASSRLSGDLYIQSASGAGQPELLLKSPFVKHASDWSADGRFIIFDEQRSSSSTDLWLIDLQGDRKPIPFLTTPASEYLAQFSPDDRWVAYSSDESGRREVYVRDFAPDRIPAVGSTRITISNAGGDKPRWRPDGREIYYIAPGGMMMAVPVKRGPALEPGMPVPLFQTNTVGTFPYDVTADGRFLVNTAAEEALSAPITVVVNWQAALKK
jgi:Tol biopolymer transport system component